MARAWAVLVEESEKASRQVKEGADALAGPIMEKIGELCAEKKANRKQYQEESQRIQGELRRLQDGVSRLRGEYERCLEGHAAARSKLEEQVGRARAKQQAQGGLGAGANRKLEDARERCVKACRQLHQTHNKYVLLLCEACEFERDMRTILLPGDWRLAIVGRS